MTGHILCVGPNREMTAAIAALAPEMAISLLCSMNVLADLRAPQSHERVLVLSDNAPTEEWVALAETLHSRHSVDFVVSFGERDQLRAAAIGEALGRPMHSMRSVQWIYDKHALRSRLAECGIRDTPFAILGRFEDLEEFINTYGFPLIVKPATSTGSRSIFPVANALELELVRDAIEQSLRVEKMIIERLHVGFEYSIETFSEAGQHQVVAITRQYSDPHTRVEIGHCVPAPISEATTNQISDYVAQFLTSLQVEFGPSHSEVILTTEGPRLVETHARLAGDDIADMVKVALGVDLVSFIARQSLGERGLLSELKEQLGGLRSTTQRYSAAWYVTSPISVPIDEISSVTELLELSGVDAVKVYVEPGETVTTLTSSERRLAVVRAHGESPEEALALARSVVESIEFRVTLPTMFVGTPV